MRNYERNGVNVDQCTECRGIFLDRGELEQLIDAESRWHSGEGRSDSERDTSSGGGLGAMVGEVMQQARARKQGGYDKHGEHHKYDEHGRYDEHGGPRRKKESFLGDLFG